MLLRSFCGLVALTVCQPAFGQENRHGITFRLGLGVDTEPGYFGAADNAHGITGNFKLDRLQLGGVSMGGRDNDGLGFGASVRFIGDRKPADYPELGGLTDIVPSLELGGGLEFNAPGFEVFAHIRYGVVGHETFVAEMGGDIFYRPSDQITLSAGPRILWGSDDYAQTYFGVNGAESLVSSFDAFDAGGGMISAGIVAKADYQINDTWGVTGQIRYDQLRNDAADSPITASDDQVSASLAITRRITLRF